MLTTRTIATLATLSVSSLSLADMIVYQNTGELGALVYYDPNFGNVIYGQSLDITLGTNQQPKAGETPAGSIFFMHLIDLNGEFIWMGTGSVTNTARSTDFILIPTQLGPEGVPFYGPQVYHTGDSIDETANFVDGWRPIHGYVRARRRLSHEDALDATQEFFLWMMSSGFLTRADPSRGRR